MIYFFTDELVQGILYESILDDSDAWDQYEFFSYEF